MIIPIQFYGVSNGATGIWTYNAFEGALATAAGQLSADLKDDTNTSTGYTLDIITPFTGATGGEITAVADAGNFPEKVLDYYWYFNGTPKLRLGGLTDGDSYNIEFIGHQSTHADRDTNYTVDGGFPLLYDNSGTDTPNAPVNISGTVSGTTLDIDMSVVSVYGYVNAIRIDITSAGGGGGGKNIDFTAADGTALTAYDANFVKAQGAADISVATIQSNGLQVNSWSSLILAYTGETTEEVEVQLVNGIAQTKVGPAIRVTGLNYYYAAFETDDGTDYTSLALYKDTTRIASFAGAWPIALPQSILLVGAVNGSDYDLNVYVNGSGTPSITHTDTSPLAAGEDGIVFDDASAAIAQINYFVTGGGSGGGGGGGVTKDFVAADGTALSTYDSNFSKAQGAADLTAATIQSNALQFNSWSNLIISYTGQTSDDVQLTILSGIAQTKVGPAIRVTGTDYYYAAFETDDGTNYTNLALFKNTTRIASFASTWLIANDHEIHLIATVNGSDLDFTVAVDGTTHINFTDNAPLPVGEDGIVFDDASTDIARVGNFITGSSVPANAAPTANDQTFSISSGVSNGDTVGTYIATDSDGAIASYSITGATLAIDNAGVITIADNTGITTGTDIVATVTATDDDGATDTATITVNVNVPVPNGWASVTVAELPDEVEGDSVIERSKTDAALGNYSAIVGDVLIFEAVTGLTVTNTTEFIFDPDIIPIGGSSTFDVRWWDSTNDVLTAVSTATVNNLGVPDSPSQLVLIDNVQANKTSVTVTFSYPGSDVTSFEYNIGGGWIAATSPLTITGLTEDTTYNFSLRPLNGQFIGTETTQSITTAPAVDTTPNAFSFNTINNVATSLYQTSNSITVNGVDAGVDIPISVSNGEYSVSTDGGTTWGAWTATATNVRLNYRVRVRHMSSANYNTAVTTALTIGTVVGNFTTNTVLDTEAPVITLTGGNVSIEEGTSWVEPGYTAVDNADGVIPANQVTITGTVNTSQVGSNSLTYTATDSAGNVGTATRTVTVTAAIPADSTPPVISLNGGNIEIDEGDTWVEPGYSATDNADGNITGSVTVSGSVNTSIPGPYTLTYSVTDQAGNSTSVTRTVTVRTVIVYPLDFAAPSNRTYIAQRLNRVEMGEAFFIKDESEILDYDFDLTDWLAYQSDTLPDGNYSVEISGTGLKNVGLGKVPGTDRVKVWLSGGASGANGSSYAVELTIITARFRVAKFLLRLAVVNRV